MLRLSGAALMLLRRFLRLFWTSGRLAILDRLGASLVIPCPAPKRWLGRCPVREAGNWEGLPAGDRLAGDRFMLPLSCRLWRVFVPDGRDGLDGLDGRLAFDGLEGREEGPECRDEGLEGREAGRAGLLDGRLMLPRFCVLLREGLERLLDRLRDWVLLRCGLDLLPLALWA